MLDAGRPAQIADALARGYAKVADLDEGGAPKVLLYKAVDQLRQCLDTIHERPGDRRILFHGWNWAQIEEMALPPCHLLYQFLPNASTREISLCLYIRSNDVGLGTPFNLTEGRGAAAPGRPADGLHAALVHVFHRRRAHLRESLADAARTAPSTLRGPRLVLSDRIPDFAATGREPEWLERVEPGDFTLEGYAAPRAGRHGARCGSPGGAG